MEIFVAAGPVHVSRAPSHEPQQASNGPGLALSTPAVNVLLH